MWQKDRLQNDDTNKIARYAVGGILIVVAIGLAAYGIFLAKS